MKTKIFITGHARHGKGTLAHVFSKYGFILSDSSEICAKSVVMPYMANLGFFYDSVEQCFEDRVNHRPLWFDAIRKFNEKDPSRLSRQIFSVSDIYVGIRNADELNSSRNLADIIIWVDASERMPVEKESSITITRDMADVVIENNGSLQEFLSKSEKLARILSRA